MVNSLFNAITKQLGTTLGNTYHYYVEDIEQGVENPCFNITSISTIERSTSPTLYDMTIPIVIYYFSDNKLTNNKECYSIAETVVECLEYLPFKETILRGEDISWRIVEGVLEIFITYEFKTAKVVVNDDMETLQDTTINYKD